MCLALYIGSTRTLPLIPYPDYPRSALASAEWPQMAQRFCTAELAEEEQVVRRHFSMPIVVLAGSYEGCSCGFNYGRQYPGYENEKEDLRAAQESVSALVAYIRDNQVRELYACWFGDESLPHETERRVTIAELSSATFFFREKELLHVGGKSSVRFSRRVQNRVRRNKDRPA